VSIRLLTGLTAFALLVGPALANDKKKGAATPETTPAPVIVPASAVAPPGPMRVLPPPISPPLQTATPAEILLPPAAASKLCCDTQPWLWTWLVGSRVLPSPHYLEMPSPQFIPAEPQFPLPRELAYHEKAAGLLNPEDRLVVRTYSVGDLVVPLPKAGQPELPKTLEAQLIKSITTTVHPKSWKSAGGAGTLEYFPLGMALIVNAVPDVHKELAKYLDHVRQMNDLQIAIDVTVVRVSTEGLERSGLAKDFLPSKDKPHEIRTRIKFFSPDDLAAFRLDRDSTTDITGPKLTVLNGQEGCVTVGQVEHFLTGVTVQSVNDAIVFVPRNEPQQTGIEVKIEGNVSGDKRFVKLAVNARARDVSVRPVAQIPVTVPIPGIQADGKPAAEKAPFTQFIEDPKFVTRSVNETVTVPDGGTVVFYGGKADFERKILEKLPMLADVPVLAELFVKEKKETATDHLLIFATTRIVNPQAGLEECETPCCAKNDRLGKLMAEYAHACKTGKSAEALKLAVECLSIDPTCFAKSK
jgi:hypothetical protein